MDVSDLVRRLLHRWIAVLAVVVLALAVAAVGWASSGQDRQTVAAVVIVPPKFGNDVTGQNPLLNLDNNLAQLATVLAQAMQSSSVGDALQRNGASGSFTVSTVTGTNPSFSQLSPQLQFTVTGTDEQQTLFSARTIVSQARIQLAALQDRAGVAASARATLVESAEPTSADVVSGGRLRVAGSLGLGVLVLGLLAVLVLDTVLGRRRTTRPYAVEPVPVVDAPEAYQREERPEPIAETVPTAPAAPTGETRVADLQPTGPVDALLDLDRSHQSTRPARAAAKKSPTKKVAVTRSPAKRVPTKKAATKDGGRVPATPRAAMPDVAVPDVTVPDPADGVTVPPNGSNGSTNGARIPAATPGRDGPDPLRAGQ